LDLIGQVLPVVSVLVLEEVLAGLLEVLGLSVRVILENVSGLEKDSVSVVVELGPPLRELLVVLGISVDLVKRILHAVHGLAVGESLEESSELNGSVRDCGVALEGVGGLGTLVGDVLGVLLVGFLSAWDLGTLPMNSLEKNWRSHSIASW
jgi:hypothetical protein